MKEGIRIITSLSSSNFVSPSSGQHPLLNHSSSEDKFFKPISSFALDGLGIFSFIFKFYITNTNSFFFFGLNNFLLFECS